MQKLEIPAAAASPAELWPAAFPVPLPGQCGIISARELEHWGAGRRLRTRHLPVRNNCHNHCSFAKLFEGPDIVNEGQPNLQAFPYNFFHSSIFIVCPYFCTNYDDDEIGFSFKFKGQNCSFMLTVMCCYLIV